jgi:hypothetical protein
MVMHSAQVREVAVVVVLAGVGVLVAAAVVLGPLAPAGAAPLPQVVDVHQPVQAQP